LRDSTTEAIPLEATNSAILVANSQHQISVPAKPNRDDLQMTPQFFVAWQVASITGKNASVGSQNLKRKQRHLGGLVNQASSNRRRFLPRLRPLSAALFA
jgi:hypothetical protein